MKKSLIALAVMAAAGAASAQSSVTLFGIVDATLNWSKSSGGTLTGAGDTRFRVTNSGYNSSRLGFRGTEDLGGGMSASFWLEAALNNDDGTGAATGGGLNFQRRSTVSLAGNWGELRIGRDYTPSFWNLTVFDPFGTNGVGTTVTLQSAFTGGNTVRASNSIGYFAPRNLGGFYGQVQYGENELPNTTTPSAAIDNGRYMGFRVGYAAGPFNVALGVGRTDMFIAPGVDDDITQMNLGGQWDFGVAKLMGQFVKDDVNGVDAKGWLIGGLVPMGAGEIRASYSQYKWDLVGDPRVRKLALGYVHNLSKRTAVYATVARARASDGATTAQMTGMSGLGARSSAAGSSVTGTGFDFGIRHSF